MLLCTFEWTLIIKIIVLSNLSFGYAESEVCSSHVICLIHVSWFLRAQSTQQPPYLASLLHLSNIHRQLRLSISQIIIPKTKLNLGKRAFSVATPRVWSKLLITLKTSESLAIFLKKLKTYLFQLAFPP